MCSGLWARGAALDPAFADFAELDADQNELDDAALIGAVKTGCVKAQPGLEVRIGDSLLVTRFG